MEHSLDLLGFSKGHNIHTGHTRCQCPWTHRPKRTGAAPVPLSYWTQNVPSGHAIAPKADSCMKGEQLPASGPPMSWGHVRSGRASHYAFANNPTAATKFGWLEIIFAILWMMAVYPSSNISKYPILLCPGVELKPSLLEHQAQPPAGMLGPPPENQT